MICHLRKGIVWSVLLCGLLKKIKSKTLLIISIRTAHMIDTICLLIPKDKMRFIQGVSSWELYSKTDQYTKYVRNPSKAEKETGKYFPRLTGYKRRFSQDANVRLEFSVPKLLYLNNLDELEDKDFPEVLKVLQERLQLMGIVIPRILIENASVSSVHFSKNIELEGGYTVSHLITEMNKVDLRKSFDFAKTRFMNDGQSLYAHTTSHEFVIYDKVADLKKGKKRAIDKTPTQYQQSLFAKLEARNQLTEIIRFEVRLNSKQKMNKVLEDLGYQKNPSFKNVFNEEMSRRVVTSYWEKIIKERSFGLFALSVSAKDILQTLFLADTNIKPKQAIYLFGLFTLAKDENGLRQLRSIVSKRSHDRTWYRIVEDMKHAGDLITKNNLKDWVLQIDRKLEEYKPYKCGKLSTSDSGL